MPGPSHKYWAYKRSQYYLKITSLHKIGIKLHKINKINIYPNNIYEILIVCCLISAPKVSKWLAHDLECFSDVKGVA